MALKYHLVTAIRRALCAWKFSSVRLYGFHDRELESFNELTARKSTPIVRFRYAKRAASRAHLVPSRPVNRIVLQYYI